MLNLALLTLATLSPATAQAADPWTYAPVQDGGFGWRHNSVKRVGGSITVETLTYYGKPDAERKYSWRVQTVTFNCAARNLQTVAGTYLDPAGKTVMPVAVGMVWPVKDGSTENIVFQVLCNRANLTDGKMASNRA
ncbi:MAG: hypothetical protein EOP61_27195, partial [Sphingomonadales bacterium]